MIKKAKMEEAQRADRQVGGLSVSNHRFPTDPKRQVRQAM